MKTIITSLLLSLALTSSGQVEIPKCASIALPEINVERLAKKTLNGEFLTCQGDSVLKIESYLHGVLDGKYIEYGSVLCDYGECDYEGHNLKKEGQYKRGLKEGKWTVEGPMNHWIGYPEKTMYYSNGKLEGNFKLIYFCGESKWIGQAGLYRDEKKQGKWIFDDGIFKTVIHFKNSIKHGNYKSSYNGEGLISTGEYVNGQKNGEWIENNAHPDKKLPVYKMGKVIRYEQTEQMIEEEKYQFVKYVLFALLAVTSVLLGFRVPWKKLNKFISFHLAKVSLLLSKYFNSKYLPWISLVLNVACWLMLFLMPLPGEPRVGLSIVRVFFGILLVIPLILSIISVSIKNKNGRITLSILATIGALLFLIPNIFFDY